MNLEVGMYVRTKDKRGIQYIRKIESVNETYPDKMYAGIYIDKEIHNVCGVALKNIVKASFNIIDLIEVGDYVNGYMVRGTSVSTLLLDNFNMIQIDEEDIKSILTKEQFESMSYKVERGLYGSINWYSNRVVMFIDIDEFSSNCNRYIYVQQKRLNKLKGRC